MSKFQSGSTVRVLAKGKWHRRHGTVTDSTTTGQCSLMFGDRSPTTRTGRRKLVYFHKSELELVASPPKPRPDTRTSLGCDYRGWHIVCTKGFAPGTLTVNAVRRADDRQQDERMPTVRDWWGTEAEAIAMMRRAIDINTKETIWS